MKFLSFEILDLLKLIENNDFKIIIVGGAVRNFLLFNKIDSDLDLEIRGRHDESVEKSYSRLIYLLQSFQLTFEELPYYIIKLKQYNLEFAFPRVETFLDEKLDHKNFRAEFSNSYSVFQSFLRRDFTINAIGMNLAGDLIDPYNGKADLENKILKKISNDCYRDPVRFLRLIRFSLQFQMAIESNIFNGESFNLIELSAHYFNREMFKIDCLSFLAKMQCLLNQYPIILPTHMNWIKNIDFNITSIRIDNIKLLLVYLSIRLNRKDGHAFVEYFKISESFFKSILLINESFKFLSTISNIDVYSALDLSVEKFKEHPIAKNLQIFFSQEKNHHFYKNMPLTAAELNVFSLKLVKLAENELAPAQAENRKWLIFQRSIINLIK